MNKIQKRFTAILMVLAVISVMSGFTVSAQTAGNVFQAHLWSAKSGSVAQISGSFDGTAIGNIAANDWVRYDGVDFGTGNLKTFNALVAVDSANAGKSFQIRLDSTTGTLIGTFTVASTGSFSTYKEQQTNISTVTGVHNLFLAFPQAAVANIDWFTFDEDLTGISTMATDAEMQWWRDAKFGMFIHWDMSSVGGVEISWDRQAARSFDIGSPYSNSYDSIYDNYYKQFNPTNFNPDYWVQVAKDGGMKYIVITAKHHGGFSMFDSAYAPLTYDGTGKPYDIMSTPYAQDIIGKLADACHRAGMKFGIYYSQRDWYHPDYLRATHDKYLNYFFGQLNELCTKYGKIDILWFDSVGSSSMEQWRPYSFIRKLRKWQPGILINNRAAAVLGSYNGASHDLWCDFDTPEQQIGAFQVDRDWESCMCLNSGGHWSYVPNNGVKTLKECINYLVSTSCGDGNLLLDTGPMPSGDLEQSHVDRYREMGTWLTSYGESIYGTRGGPFVNGSWGGSTYKGNTIYVHLLSWNGTITLPPIPAKITASSCLTGGTPAVSQSSSGVSISLPSGNIDPLDTIIKLTVQKSNLAFMSTANASNFYQYNCSYGPSKAMDAIGTTRWATDDTTGGCWLEVDFGANTTFDRVITRECVDWGQRVSGYKIQYWNGGSWLDAYTGTTIGAAKTDIFSPVTGSKARLNITSVSANGPTVWEFEVYNGNTPTPLPAATPSPTPTPSATPVPRNAFSQIEAESFDSKSGTVQAEACGEGGQNLGYIATGDYVVYNNVDFGSGAGGFDARIAGVSTSGKIDIRLDSSTGTLVGSLIGANSGGWQTYTTKSASVSGASGKHNLYLVFTAGLNLNWFKFTVGATPTPMPTATPTQTPTPTPVGTATPSPTPYVPTTGLKLWLKADAGITKDASGFVSAWADQSGSGNNASQGNASYQPKWVDGVVNGKPVVRFDGSNDSIASTGPTGTMNTYSVLFVIKAAVLTNYDQNLGAGGGWGQFKWHTTSTGGVYTGTSGTSRISPTDGPGDGTVVANTWHRFSFVFNNGASKFYKNGTQLASKTLDLPVAWTGFALGQQDTNTINGDIAEMLVYNTALSDTDRQSAEQYLKNKYGIN
jgi:alpha-L-fucosidase